MKPFELQKLVDGECSHACRAAILQTLNEQPDQWRTLALALLEEQQWAKELANHSTSHQREPTALAAGVLPRAKDSTSHPTVKIFSNAASSSTSATTAVATNSTNSIAESSVELTGAKATWRTSPLVPVLAASLLLAIGYYGGSSLSSFSSQEKVGQVGTAPITKVSSNAYASQAPIDYSSMKIVVTGPDSEKSEIPIYEQDGISVMLAKKNYEIARTNLRLRKKGFELDVRPEYYMGKLNDGRQLIVPVNYVGLKPYGQ